MKDFCFTRGLGQCANPGLGELMGGLVEQRESRVHSLIRLFIQHFIQVCELG